MEKIPILFIERENGKDNKFYFDVSGLSEFELYALKGVLMSVSIKFQH